MNLLTSKITHSLQYFHAVSKHLCVKEESTHLAAHKASTKGVDIKNAINSVLSESITSGCLAKHISVATEKSRKHSGEIALMMKDNNYPEFLHMHYVINRKH